MTRLTTSILALLVFGATCPGHAQQRPEESDVIHSVRRARFGLTPLFGVRAPLVSHRRAAVVVPGALRPVVVIFDAQHGEGGVAGAEAELRLAGPVTLAGALGFTNPDEIVTTVQTQDGIVTQTVLQGPAVYFGRVDLAYELPAPRSDTRAYRPAASFMIGPALVREDYGDGVLALPGGDDRVDNWALHVGAKGLLPFGSEHVFIHLSVEDYATFWNPRDQERQRVERLLELQPGTVTSAAFDYNTTHVIMVNLGLSLRI